MVEQLCYTRPTIGSFQVRAASDGVTDRDSVHLVNFGKYLRYALPTGTDSLSANTENQPFCLVYIDVGGERIVVHQVYQGQDSQGRSDVCFGHLLANLPTDF